MASSSSASTSYSPPPWDVFINHRGPDVKRTFASYLYRSLDSRGLRVFLDKEELEAGQNIPSQIQQAIRGAAVHVAIFSKTYAESTWCLDELVLMVESVQSGKIILPVFYKVQPSVLRHTVKDGTYAHALRELEEKTAPDPETREEKPRYNSDSFRKWRDALSFVADISGFVILDDDDEGELLDKVVESVLKSIPKPLLYVAKYATGLNQKLEEFETTVLQKQETERVEAKVVGIWGVGGVGKTTLAKEFFNLRRSHYSKSSFLFNVRETIKTKPVNYLQSKLLQDLTDRKQEIESGDEGVEILRKSLSSCHAFIVVDDVDDASQMDALLPFRAFLNPDSLILATTRDKHVLISSGVLESSIYNMKGLSQLHSTELFCCYALNQPSPSQEFAALTDRFVKACDGLPLLLKVLGALVCGRCESYWEATLDRGLSNTEIEKSLKISYDSLSSDDKQIFLDIASFFIGKKRDVAIRIWGLPGFQNLQDRCLLDVDAENSIRMHDHIRDLASNIAQRLGTRCLCQQSTENIDDLLRQSSNIMTQVRGITMRGCHLHEWSPPRRSEMSIPWRPRWLYKVFGEKHLFNDSPSCGISDLEFVATEDRYLKRILKKARSPNLRWLRWYKCPYPWYNVTELLTQLEHQLSLKELHMGGHGLQELPSWIGNLCNLERLHLSVSGIKHLPQELLKMNNLLYLKVEFCPLLELPFKRIEEERELNKLESFHDDDKCLFALKEISLSYTRISEVFFSGCVCPNLESLTLEWSLELTQIGGLCGLSKLQFLNIHGCGRLEELPNLEMLISLEILDVSHCIKLRSIPGLGQLKKLRSLDVCKCDELLELSGAKHLMSLELLSARGCPKLRWGEGELEQLRQRGVYVKYP